MTTRDLRAARDVYTQLGNGANEANVKELSRNIHSSCTTSNIGRVVYTPRGNGRVVEVAGVLIIAYL